ncbi:MAG: serine/threonine protein kinase, partial [Anaerolineae bacterium]|nr:serine/threonine protein kinase [Anaerolineae bacterium]
MSSSLVGRKIGQYEIKSLIGRGGMATVYLGYQATIDRQVAIKVLPPHLGLGGEFVERFQLEARTVARLQHPHILPLYDYGNVDDTLYFIAPYISGGSLERLMSDGPMDPLIVERLLREIASALDYAHRQDVIHRDIKPGNILIDNEGHALLADFGIAKITGSSTNLTGTGVVGTPAYMAPEQVQGIPDARSDIYSLGIVIYEMLSGLQPYRSENTMQVMLAHVQSPIPPILTVAPNLTPALEPVMLRVMAKDPADRYFTASEFAEDFSRALHKGESLAAIHAAVPLSEHPTYPKVSPPTSAAVATPISETAYNPTPTQTIIVQQSPVNTKILLAGFGVLALLILGGIAFIASQNQPSDIFPVTPGANVLIVPPPGATIIEDEPPATEIVELKPNFGAISFSKLSTPGDTLSLRLQGVKAPGNGKVYVAWLVNTRDESHLNLGRVAVDALGNGSLAYTDETGALLPALYNAITITEEDVANEAGAAPQGETFYSGIAPIEVMDVFNQVFIASDNGFRGAGLLSSALTEARFASQHAGLASGATNIGGLHTHAEHTINILNGTTTDHDGNGSGQNPGTGTGIYAYLDAIEAILGTATSASTVTFRLQNNA